MPLETGAEGQGPADYELGRDSIEALLADLDARLRERGVAASVFVVGGAAMILRYGRQTSTLDVDIYTNDETVLEEAEELAREQRIPTTWLSGSVGRFMPPRPDEAMQAPTRAGLTVHVAEPRFMLAMKLVAGRKKDRPDIRLLMTECGLVRATPDEVVKVMRETYSGEDQLAHALSLSGADPDETEVEARRIAEAALGLMR